MPERHAFATCSAGMPEPPCITRGNMNARNDALEHIKPNNRCISSRNETMNCTDRYRKRVNARLGSEALSLIWIAVNEALHIARCKIDRLANRSNLTLNSNSNRMCSADDLLGALADVLFEREGSSRQT